MACERVKPTYIIYISIERERERAYPYALILKFSASIYQRILREIKLVMIHNIYIYIYIYMYVYIVCFWRDSSQWAMASSYTRFLDHTQRRTTVSRTPLDERSARRRDLYLTTHTHTQHSQETKVHAPSGIRTHNLSRRTEADLCL